MTENDETSDKNLSTSENTKTCQEIESQNMPEGQTIHRYNREEMLKIRENALSRTRPKEFSKEFDNEDGFFSPDKWLQHKWQCEGVENRGKRGGKTSSNVSGTTNALAAAAGIGVTSKLLGAIFEASSNNNNTNGLDQQMILSPQRRGFSSGCRASSPSRNNDEEKATKLRWRQGHLSSNGMDFKPAFQKSALEANNCRSSSSRSNSNNATSNIAVGGSASFTMLGGSSAKQQQNWDKDKNRRGGGGGDRGERSRYSTNTENEQMPEWMNDGPTSHLDIIELKGFDDDNSAGGANANNGANEKNQKRRSKGKEPQSAAVCTQSKTSNKDGGGGSDEKTKGGRTATNSPRSSSTRQKRHSSGDVGGKNNHSNSRPTSRNTQSRSNCASRKNSVYSPANPTKVIQASELESLILMEHQNRLNKEKGTDGTGFDLFSTLGIELPKQKMITNQKEEKPLKKIPNTDAEFAEFILGVSVNQIGCSQQISGAKQEPTSSRLSRFFPNNANENGKQLNKNSNKSIKEDKLLTKSQFDISSLQQTLYQQAYGGGRQSSSPHNNILTSPQLRPASTELSQQQRFPSPNIVFRQQSPTFNNLMKFGALSSNKFLPGMPFGANITPERDALFQQMQAANLPTVGHHQLHSQQHFSPSPVHQFQQQQQFLLNQLRKQRTSPPTIQMPHTLFHPGIVSPPPRPSSVEHQSLNSSPMMFPPHHRQSPQPMGMPPFGPNSSNGFANFPIHIQHLLLETARRMQPNQNLEPGPEHIRAAFYELINQKEPKLRHYMMQQMQLNNNNPQFGLPIGIGGGGSFPPMGNPSPFHHSPQMQMFTGSSGGPPLPFHHQQHGIGMHHHGGGGQFGFPPPPGSMPIIPPHMPQFGGAPPPYFSANQQFANMNPPPPQFTPLPPNAVVNHHQKQPPPNNPTNLLNSTFFMPTSVIRQMSKMPGSSGGGGSNNCGNGGDTSDSFVDLGPTNSNNNSSIFLQKLFGGGGETTNSVKSAGGRAILGRDPDEEGGLLPPRNVPRISGCLKLEDIEQRELAALQQQQQQSSSTSSSLRNPIISSSNAPTDDPAAKQNTANFL